jgi:signal transduction histidine kinase
VTSIETGHSWSERLSPRNWTLTWKLVVVGLVPALLALVLGVLRVSDQAGEAADLGRSTRLLEVQQQVVGAADALRQERDEATLFTAGGRSGDRGVLEIGFGQADGEIDEMLTAVRGTGELDPTTVSALQEAEGQLSQLQVLRDDATANPAVDARQVRTRYDEVIEGVDVLDRAMLRQVRTPGVAGLADALTEVTSAREQLAVQHTVLGAAIRSGRLLPDEASEIATDSELATALREYQAALTPDQVEQFGNFLDGAANSQRERLKAAILATPPDQPVTLAASEWDTAYNGSRAALDRTADLLRNELVAASVAAEEQASNLAGVNSVVLMLGLLIGIAVAVLIARALIRSLRVLRTSALDVAERRLPLAVESMRAGQTPDVTVDPVPLSGRDEVGQVARAFDAVHGQAVRLAADQAALQAGVSAMFVNLSRRSQALVERQLQLIEQLESNEQDADQLSNLFQLDHLATRMRRNSENLLVLAGTDLAKRNVAPVPMVDVLRAAVSEVESYQRIIVQTPPTATVAGRAASDVVHLLAELLDNATNFSPPDSQVVMSTARTSDGMIVVEIADRGVGMAEHELGDANHRLSGPSSVDVSASRRMGLFVVGRLAARHGIGVRLSTSSAGSQGGGLTASVTVPAHLIPSIEPVELSRTAGLPLAASAPGARPGVPPQRGVNGTARAGGLSSLVAGADGPANPTGVFDAPSSTDGQLFTPSPSSNGGSPSPNGGPPALPSRRPGSSLHRGSPPGPPEQGNGPDPERTSDEQAREVAEQARRDQEEAAARAEEAGRNGNHLEAPRNGRIEPEQQREADTGHRWPHRPVSQHRADQRRPDQNRADQNGMAQGFTEQRGPAPQGEGQASTGQPPAPPHTGLPRRTPGRPAQQPEQQRNETSGPVQPTAFQPAPARPAQAQPDQEQGTPAEPAPARPEASQPRPAPAPGHRESGPAERDQAEQSRQEWASPAQEPEQDEAAAEQAPASVDDLQDPQPEQDLSEAPEHTPAATQEGESALTSDDAGLVSPPTMPMPTVRRPAAGPAAGQPAPRPTPRPTPRPFPSPGRSPAPSAEAAAPASPPAQPAAAPVPARSDGDGLFAPNVPVIAEPDTRAPVDARPSSGFDLGETTPIFEEIASAWFRSNRPIPVNWQTEQDDKPAPRPAAPRPAPAPRPSPAPAPAPAPTAAPAPTPAPAPAPLPVRQQAPAPAPAPAPPTSEVPVTAAEQAGVPAFASEQEFASLADEGWRAANGAAAERPDEVTAAGLPKRRPRARLVPGSAGSAVLAPPPASARSAETIRGRLASYQQGVRQGRESRTRGDQQHQGSAFEANGGTGPANAGGNHDEESS